MKTLFTSLFLISSLSAFSQQVTIDATKHLQTIEGFGASDAWSTEVLKTFSESKQNTAAKWLFKSDLKSNKSVDGIGLSIWRFALGPFGNMPAGSSTIPQDYLDEKGSYVWDINPGKQLFLDKAKQYGCDQFGAWSACILPQLRPNGLDNEAFKNYGNFLADILSYYRENDVVFKYIAPVNEPQYTWVEGIKWTTSNISKMTRAVCDALAERGDTTPVMLGECADWTNLYDTFDNNNHWARNQVNAYFEPLSVNYLGDLPNLMHELGVHSYWTDQDSTRLSSMRTLAKKSADKKNLKLHQTEWSLLSNPPIEGLPETNATDMDIALITSKVIHCDLHYAGVNSWCYWEAFGSGKESHFHLIQTDELNKTVKARKNLWVLGNYSLFIRPGYKRIEMTNSSNLNSLMATSYISPDNETLVSVYTNISYSKIDLNPVLKLPEGYSINKIRKYQTSSLYDLQLFPASIDSDISIPSRSVVTLVYDLNQPTSLDSSKDESYNINYTITNNDFINIQISSLGSSAVYLYSPNGVLMHSEKFIDQSNITLPSNINKGIYFLKIENSKNNLVVRIAL